MAPSIYSSRQLADWISRFQSLIVIITAIEKACCWCHLFLLSGSLLLSCWSVATASCCWGTASCWSPAAATAHWHGLEGLHTSLEDLGNVLTCHLLDELL